MNLTDEERVWIKHKWRLIRASQMEADRADKEWKRINAAITAKHDAEDTRRAIRGLPPLTDLLKSEAMSASLPLNDALATGNWHARNAERHIHDLNLYLRLKELGIL